MAKKQQIDESRIDSAMSGFYTDITPSGSKGTEKKKTQETDANVIPGVTRNSAGFWEVETRLIEEDPANARKTFDPEKLQELADSIKKTGQIDAITVYPNPEKPGNFIIEAGARRFRAITQILKRKKINAIFVKEQSAKRARQSNEMRVGFNNMEILADITANLEKGMKKGEIAELWGKKESWVTRFVSITKNNAVKEALESGKITSPQVAYDLTLLSNKGGEASEAVNQLLESKPEIVSADVAALKDRLKNPPKEEASEPLIPYTTETFQEDDGGREEGEDREPAESTKRPEADDGDTMPLLDPDEAPSPTPKQPKPIITVMYKDEAVTLLNKMPSKKTRVVVKDAAGDEKEVQAKDIGLPIRVWSD